MENIFGKLPDLILLIVVMTFATILFLSVENSKLQENCRKVQTEAFLDAVAEKGELTQKMWEDFNKKLYSFGVRTDIELSVKREATAPEYALYSVSEADKILKDLWEGSNVLMQEMIHTDRPAVTVSMDSDASLTKDTNESILAAAIDTPADSSHEHTQNCYAGHNHEVCGCTNHTHSSACYGLRVCGMAYPYGAVTILGSGYYVGYRCSSCGTSWGAWSETNSFGPQQHTSYGLQCTLQEGWNCGYTLNDSNPLCDEIILDITPTHQEQTVYQNAEMITTATLMHMDGSQTTVLCNADRDTSKTGVFIVTLSFYGLISATEYGTVTCTETVTVLPCTTTCERGHIYPAVLSECPYCDAYVESLTVTGLQEGKTTAQIYTGTSLQENGIGLLVTYMDGDMEERKDGWEDNLDNDYIGTQTVTLSYKGEEISLQVTVLAEIVLCKECGNSYARNPDGSDPGCPYCYALIPYFTGETLVYETYISEPEIMADLYDEDEICHLTKGDILTISVVDRGGSLSSSVLSILPIQNTAELMNPSVSYTAVVRKDNFESAAYDVADENENSQLTTETNESIMAAAIDTPADIDHTHTEFCYAGHNHLVYGCSYHEHTPDCFAYHTHTDECLTYCGLGQLVSSSVLISISMRCSYCGFTTTAQTGYDNRYFTFACPICSRMLNNAGWNYIGLSCSYRCNTCGTYFSTLLASNATAPAVEEHRIYPYHCGLETGEYALICGKSEGWSCGLEETAENPSCSEVITKIEPTNENQTVMAGSAIITTARITYMDGSETTIICDTDFIASAPGIYRVTLSFYGHINAAETGIVTCTETVNVIN